MSTENLHNEAAVSKLKVLVDKIDIGMLCSFPRGEDYPYAVPMSRQEVDEEGNIWYLFSAESHTFEHLQQNKNVSIQFSHVGDYNFLSVNGTAEISAEQARIDKYWNKMMEAWFEKGREDPAIRLLKVTPLEAKYWDNKTNKLVTVFKVAVSAISGKDLDIGREGTLNF